MAGNTFGQVFRVTTFGESHGSALGAIIDGCPPGMKLTEADIMVELERRKTGTSPFTSQRKEPDAVQILSGVFNGVTTGTPIGLVIRNEDNKSKDYEAISAQFRPGHADYTYLQKYGVRDFRGGGRASARETVMRVAAGAIAKKYLREVVGITIRGCLIQMGHVSVPILDWQETEKNPFFVANAEKVPELELLIQATRKAGDSIGALIQIEAHQVPVGLGEPVFDKLNASIAHAMMSINAVKAVEIGDGLSCVTQPGSAFRDEMTREGFLSNHAGGILGGISNGEPIIVKVAFKPTPSIIQPGRSLNTSGDEVTVVTKGRHDPCVGIRGVPIAEAMLALVLMDHYLRNLPNLRRTNE
ncbi:MAG: chorismate synthase [Legionellales bacterium]|nr:chorismate synthase [Legionellales bacterium]